MSAAALGLLVLRLVVGGIVMARGASKLALLGDRRGSVAPLVGLLRSRAPEAGVLAVGAVELVAGALFASGLLTSLAALAIAAVLLGSIRIGDAYDALWSPDARSELALAAWATAVAVAAMGAGRISLDAAIGWTKLLSGLGWGLAVLVTPSLVRVGTAMLARRGARPQATPPRDKKASFEPTPERVGERVDSSQSDSTRLFGRPPRPPRAVGLGLVQPSNEPVGHIPTIEVQLSDADDATDLIDCLWRHGLGGRLVESGSRWAVAVESANGPARGLLADVLEVLEIWLLESDRPGLLVRVGEPRAGAQMRSAPNHGVRS